MSAAILPLDESRRNTNDIPTVADRIGEGVAWQPVPTAWLAKADELGKPCSIVAGILLRLNGRWWQWSWQDSPTALWREVISRRFPGWIGRDSFVAAWRLLVRAGLVGWCAVPGRPHRLGWRCVTDENGETEMHLGFVMFLQAGADRLIKICWAVDPDARLAQIEADCPDEVRVLATVAGSQAQEQRLHATFGGVRARGDWFKPAPDLLAYIDRCAAEPQDQEAHSQDRGVHRQDQGSETVPHIETRAREPGSSSDLSHGDRRADSLCTTAKAIGPSNARAHASQEPGQWHRRFKILHREVGRRWGAQAEQRMLLGGAHMLTLQAASNAATDSAWACACAAMLRREEAPGNVCAYLAASLERAARDEERRRRASENPNASRPLPRRDAPARSATEGLEKILGVSLADAMKKVQGHSCTHDRQHDGDQAPPGNAERPPEGIHTIVDAPGEHAGRDSPARDRRAREGSVRPDRRTPEGARLELGHAGGSDPVLAPVCRGPGLEEGPDPG